MVADTLNIMCRFGPSTLGSSVPDHISQRLTPFLETRSELSLVIHVCRSNAQAGDLAILIYSDEGRLVAHRTFFSLSEASAYVEAAMQKTMLRDPSALILLKRDPDIEDN